VFGLRVRVPKNGRETILRPEQRRGETVPYSEFVVPERVICPQCWAVDQFELSPETYLWLTGALLTSITRLQGPESPIQFVQMGLADGRLMHPFEARDYYAQQVAEQPDRADLHVKYGNVLRFLGYQEETEAQYRAALEIDSGELEALSNLAVIHDARGEREAARDLMRRVIEQAPRSKHPHRKMFVEAARGLLQGQFKPGELTVTAPVTSSPPVPRGSPRKGKRRAKRKRQSR